MNNEENINGLGVQFITLGGEVYVVNADYLDEASIETLNDEQDSSYKYCTKEGDFYIKNEGVSGKKSLAQFLQYYWQSGNFFYSNKKEENVLDFDNISSALFIIYSDTKKEISLLVIASNTVKSDRCFLSDADNLNDVISSLIDLHKINAVFKSNAFNINIDGIRVYDIANFIDFKHLRAKNRDVFKESGAYFLPISLSDKISEIFKKSFWREEGFKERRKLIYIFFSLLVALISVYVYFSFEQKRGENVSRALSAQQKQEEIARKRRLIESWIPYEGMPSIVSSVESLESDLKQFRNLLGGRLDWKLFEIKVQNLKKALITDEENALNNISVDFVLSFKRNEKLATLFDFQSLATAKLKNTSYDAVKISFGKQPNEENYISFDGDVAHLTVSKLFSNQAEATASIRSDFSSETVSMSLINWLQYIDVSGLSSSGAINPANLDDYTLVTAPYMEAKNALAGFKISASFFDIKAYEIALKHLPLVEGLVLKEMTLSVNESTGVFEKADLVLIYLKNKEYVQKNAIK